MMSSVEKSVRVHNSVLRSMGEKVYFEYYKLNNGKTIQQSIMGSG